MAKISPYTSGKVKDLKVGLSSYSEGKTSLQITGNVGIGTTDPYASVGASNTSVLAVGILTANKIFSTDFGQFTGGGILVDKIVGTALSVSGISTLAKDFVVTPTSSGVGATVGGKVGVVTYFGDGSQLTGVGAAATANITADTLKVIGVSTLGVTSVTDLTAQDLDVSGISTLGNVKVSGGIVTATTGVVTYYGDGQYLTGITADLPDNLVGTALSISGIASVGAAITMYGATGIISATQYYGDGSKLSNIPSLTGVSTGVGTFIASAGVSTNIDSFAYASLDYKLAEYSLHFMNGSNIQAERIIVMQDNTTAYSNEFAIMSSSDLLISVGATISGSNVLIQATPETGVSGLTTYRWRREVQE